MQVSFIVSYAIDNCLCRIKSVSKSDCTYTVVWESDICDDAPAPSPDDDKDKPTKPFLSWGWIMIMSTWG